MRALPLTQPFMPNPTTIRSGQSVSLRRLTKSFGPRQVLKTVSLDIGAGEFLAVLGPSGSGKTTVMRLVAGFDVPDAGEIIIGDADVTGLPAEKRSVNTVFQSYALFPHMSVLDNVGFGPRMQGKGKAERNRKAMELLELVQLASDAKRMPRELSGGMQQRVALARALANEPAVLLLDEPLGALDRKLREELQRELRRIHQSVGTTFIYVTHDQEEAFGLADRLAVMRDGQFIQVGEPGAVYDAPASAWVANFLGNANSIATKVDASGALVTTAGILAAGYRDPALAAGDRAVAIVRPELTHIRRRSTTEPANSFTGSLVDLVAIGPSLRLKAVTTSGLSFEAVTGRGDTEAIQPGDAVSISFDPSAVRVYRDDGSNSSQPTRSPSHA